MIVTLKLQTHSLHFDSSVRPGERVFVRREFSDKELIVHSLTFEADPE